MSNHHAHASEDHEGLARKPEFHEVPGEAEADAMRDAFLRSAGPDLSALAGALGNADGATLSRAVSRLQQEQGNAFVQRLVASARGAPGRLVGRSQPEMVDEVVQRKGSGTPLPEDNRRQFEDFFGADLGGVRVHADAEAAALNRELNAQAFTVGQDIFVANGHYKPTSAEGQALLAHELAHVGQQGGFGAPSVQRQEAPQEDEEARKRAGKQEDEEPA